MRRRKDSLVLTISAWLHDSEELSRWSSRLRLRDCSEVLKTHLSLHPEQWIVSDLSPMLFAWASLALGIVEYFASGVSIEDPTSYYIVVILQRLFLCCTALSPQWSDKWSRWSLEASPHAVIYRSVPAPQSYKIPPRMGRFPTERLSDPGFRLRGLHLVSVLLVWYALHCRPVPLRHPAGPQYVWGAGCETRESNAERREKFDE